MKKLDTALVRTLTPFAVALLLLLAAAPPAAAGDGITTGVTLLIGHPTRGENGARGALVVPGMVVPLEPAVRSSTADVHSEGERGYRLAQVVRSLQRTLRLGGMEVDFTLWPELEVDQPYDLPARPVATALHVEVELLGLSLETATYRVAFTEGSRSIADSRVAVRRGERAVVGGLDGAEAPYVFLLLEPQRPGEVAGNEPRKVGDGIQPPVRLQGSQPAYTAEAKEARIQGVVIVQAVIDKSGEVLSVTPLKGLPLGLTEAAVEAIRTWRFSPARDAAGEPVTVSYNLVVNFHLDAPLETHP